MGTLATRLYDELTPMIDEELRVAFAMRRLGDIDTPSADQFTSVAGLIADEVMRCIYRRRVALDPMNASEVLRVLDALEVAGVRAGVTGGWGIDALLRRQTRLHDDLDLGVASDDIDVALGALRKLGYAIVADERPARIVLESVLGKVDIHPIVMLTSGAGVQTGFDGQTFEYPAGSLEAAGEIGGQAVRCGTPELQLTFHRAYEPRAHDLWDMSALAEAFDLTLEPPYSG